MPIKVAVMLGLLMLGWFNPQSFAKERSKAYLPVNMADFIALESAYSRLFTDWEPDLLEGFYQLTPLSEQQRALWSLQAKPELGWGELKINGIAKPNLFVQVPHGFYDKHTAKVAEHWFASGLVKVLMKNSVHRHLGRNSEMKFNSDFTSAKNNPMVAATRSFVRHHQPVKVVQLHGFSGDKRQQSEVKNAPMIISHGKIMMLKQLDELDRLATCIKQDLNIQALVFPSQVGVLGGTKNIVAKQLHRLGMSESFYHLELSLPTRQALSKDKHLALGLLHCIVEGLS